MNVSTSSPYVLCASSEYKTQESFERTNPFSSPSSAPVAFLFLIA